MRRIRVALGDVQAAMLRDILAHITEGQPDMELVGHVSEPDVANAVARQGADVVICDVRSDSLPQVCRQLLAAQDPPVVVGLVREGREVAVCVANAGPAQLIAMIRSAVLDEQRRDNVLEMLPRSAIEREAAVPDRYTSEAECLMDQLRHLDLALLAEVDRFESTVWDEGAQRLQGLAVTPDEVRGLLQDAAPDREQRQGTEMRLRRHRMQEAIAKRIAATIGHPDAPAFVRLVERFELDPLEQFCIAAALALEIDRNKYGKAYGLLHDDVTRKQPSPELCLRLYRGGEEATRWEAARVFDRSRALLRWNLIALAPRESGEPVAPFGRRIELDERMSRFLLGLDDLGAPLGEVAVDGVWEPEVLRVAPPGDAEQRLRQLVSAVEQRSPGAPPRLVVHVHGRQGSGRRRLVASVCQARGLRLIRVDAARLASQPADAFETALLLLARETMLMPTAVCFEQVNGLLEADAPSAPLLRTLAHALQTFSPVTFIVGQLPWTPEALFPNGVFQSIALELPEGDELQRVWVEALSNVPLALEVGGAEQAARELTGRFRLSPGQVHDAVAAARTRALWERPHAPALTLRELYAGCRDQCSHRLGTLARPVATGFGWDDLILPPKQRTRLRELETAIRNSSGVLHDWNFQSRLPYGRGITALFSGPSGTGKTMAAGILARELGLDLYKIDLSRVVSKYIGETEKNLDRIFQQAEDANAMLFFDEADALFGKRSAIKDAHDRYANIEVAYLLQKMEERLGVTILATNLKANLDEAFARRIRFAIEFPILEHAERLEVWRHCLPPGIPLSPDVDLPLLARRLRISGGSIMNICMSAASLAYAPGGEIRMEHFAHAARRELEKLGQQYQESDFTPREPVGAGPARQGRHV